MNTSYPNLDFVAETHQDSKFSKCVYKEPEGYES